MKHAMNPWKIARIGVREFASTALTKGFIIGALVVPAVLLAIMPLVIMLVERAKPPAEIGSVAVIDRSGEVAPMLIDLLDPVSIADRRVQETEAAMQRVAAFLPEGMAAQIEGQSEDIQRRAFEALGVPQLRVEMLGPDADFEAQQERLRQRLAVKTERGADRGLLAVAVIAEDAVRKADDADWYGGFELTHVPKVDDRTISEIKSALREAIRDKRYAAAGVNQTELAALTTVTEGEVVEVTETGTRSSSLELNAFLPVFPMIMILIGVFTGGQYLLTTTIEEKSSRVVEVLLSSVSPMELMTGKIMGQMGVGLSLLLIYNSVGIVALVALERLDLIAASTLVYMFVFFVLAYFMFASLLGAIGAAVNDLREAQSLMTPVMLFAMVPYFFFLPVTRDPNSVLSTTLSFIPPISPFIMVMRVASTEPPPVWQVAASIGVNTVGVLVCLWFAAKVFRVGLLMYGKPPNLTTLIKWVRMA